MDDPSPRRTAESKQKAVELYRKSGATYAEVARGPGCDAGSLAGWVKKAGAAALDLFERIEVVYNRTRITRRWAASARRSSRRPIGLRKIAARRRRKR